MAESDPDTPQVVDPELTVNLTRLLQIRGPLGVLNVLDTIVPVVNMGDVVTRSVRVEQPSFRSSNIFSSGVLVAATANTVLADTGALAEGVYDMIISGENSAPNPAHALIVEHRNAANAANLAIWNHLMSSVINGVGIVGPHAFAYEFGVNERLRLLNRTALAGADTTNGVIFARRRT